MTAVPQSAFGPIFHDRHRSFRRHLPFQLSEDHDELDHRFAGRHRGIEFLTQGHDIDIVFVEQGPQIDEVFQASRDPIEFEANDDVNLTGGNIAFQSLKLGAVLVLGGPSGIDVEIDGFRFPPFTAFAKLDLLFDLVLLCGETVTVRHLSQ